MISRLIKLKNLIVLILGILSFGAILLLKVENAFTYSYGLIFVITISTYVFLFFIYNKCSTLQWRLGFQIFHLIMPIPMFLLLEFLQRGKIFSLRPIEYILNIFLHFVIWIVLLALTRNTLAAGIIGLLFVYGLGVINYFLVLYRGEPIMPSYLYAIRTALSVADRFDYYFDERLMIGTGILIGCILWLIFTEGIWIDFKGPSFKVIIGLMILSITSLTWGFHSLTLTSDLGTGINLWDTDGFYQRHGYLLSFTIFYQNMKIKEPSGYSREKVDSYLEPYMGEEAVKDSHKPDILVVMNESLSDFEQYELGIFNQSPLEHFYEKRENTIYGMVHTSVFGGETANTEYEMLTGNPIGLLPRAALPYQEYMQGDQNSLVSLLESYGYQSMAIHPYYASGYNRDRAWDSFGFDYSYFLDSKPGILDDFGIEYYRNYVTDKSTYGYWAKQAENQISKDNRPLFSLIVTMQNHGGYSGKGFDGPKIWLKDKPHLYPQMQEFLTSVEKADVAIDELLDYIDQRQRKTIVLIFGDHQPGVEEDFFTYAMGSNQAEYQKYRTPFLIHANFELENVTPKEISANYLGLALFKEANMPLSAYQRYQEDLMKQLPVMTRQGYMDKEGRWYSKEDERFLPLISPYFELLYNNVFDNARKDKYYKFVTTGG